MRPSSDPVPRELEESLAAVRGRLGVLGASLLYYRTIGSTNDAAAALAGHQDDRLEGAVVIADA